MKILQYLLILASLGFATVAFVIGIDELTDRNVKVGFVWVCVAITRAGILSERCLTQKQHTP